MEAWEKCLCLDQPPIYYTAQVHNHHMQLPSQQDLFLQFFYFKMSFQKLIIRAHMNALSTASCSWTPKNCKKEGRQIN